MTMTPEEAHEKLAEARLRSDTMESLVEMLNLYAQFIQAESGSDLEKSLEETIEALVTQYADEGNDGIIGHMLLGALAIIFDAADWSGVQSWLTEQSREIQRMADEAHDAHSH